MTHLARITTYVAGGAFIGAWMAYAAGMPKLLIALCALAAINALVTMALWARLIGQGEAS